MYVKLCMDPIGGNNAGSSTLIHVKHGSCLAELYNLSLHYCTYLAEAANFNNWLDCLRVNKIFFVFWLSQRGEFTGRIWVLLKTFS